MASVSPATEWVSEEKLLDVVTGISGKTFFFPMAICFYGGQTTDITAS
jgi:hypothetical protein